MSCKLPPTPDSAEVLEPIRASDEPIARRTRGARRAAAGASLGAEPAAGTLDAQPQIATDRLEQCDTSTGDGIEPGTTPTQCPTCGGSGKVCRRSDTPPAPASSSRNDSSPGGRFSDD